MHRHAARCGALVAALLAGACTPNSGTDADWAAYGGHVSGDRYSALTEIDKANVASLELAWRFETPGRGESQTNPLVIDGTLFGFTPELEVFALNAATGEQLWQFDAGLLGTELGSGRFFTGPARGMSYWRDGDDERLLAGVMNYLFALDPATGKLIESFGDRGAIDLREGLRGDAAQHYVSLTTPGVVYRDLIIVGFRTAETHPAPPGDLRAFDVRSGELRWTFHTIPQAGEPGSETWPENARRTAGGANNWAGLALDEARGIVYAPTGSPVADFYGGDRRGDNLYANSLLALDAATGRLLWHFQAVRHDIWDRDFASPPSLVTVTRAGRRIDAVMQPSKQGFVYVFDRVTGEALFPLEERAYPASDVPGEVAASTQRLPTLPLPFARQRLTEELLTNRTPEARAWASAQLENFRSEGQFVPFSTTQPTVVFPGFDGGAEWGGAAIDPAAGLVFINSNDVAWTGSLVASTPGMSVAASLYEAQCALCHGTDLAGSPPAMPSLVGVGARLGARDIAGVIANGRGRMPAFPGIVGPALAGLAEYVRDGGASAAPEPSAAREPEAPSARPEMTASLLSEGQPAAYRFTGYSKFLDPDGYPAVAPPWGTLNAIDLNTGEYVWKIPFGEYPELAAAGAAATGSENYGGPLVTASGLLFIGATIYDRKLRAFDASTGELLWSAELPYAGTATPATYAVDGRQYVVIATSNARNPAAPQGGAYVAYRLPD